MIGRASPPCQSSTLSARTDPASVRAYRPTDTWKDMRALGFNDQLEVIDAAAPTAAAAAAPDPKAAAAPPAGFDAAAGAGQAPLVKALAVAISGAEAGTRSWGLGKGLGSALALEDQCWVRDQAGISYRAKGSGSARFGRRSRHLTRTYLVV